MKAPLLRYIACHRGRRISDALASRMDGGERIRAGSLRGCKRVGRAVFKVGKGYVLEFRVVIRVTP